MKNIQYISLSLLMLSSIFLLCTVFATDSSLENGLVIGKACWFHLAVLFMALCCLIAAVLTKKDRRFLLSPADGLVLLLATIVVLTYNWQLNPEPEKVLFGGQLIVLWCLLRFIFTGWPQLWLFFLAVIVGTGLIEAISGISQLHGFRKSNHSLFNLTGDFYNPGPYSGYLALILPLCLWMILEFDTYKKAGWRQTKIYLYYLAWACLLAIAIVLPAGMSRTAWIAAVVSCVWVYWMQRYGWEKTKRFFDKHRIISLVSSILLLIIIVGTLAGVYVLKKDSANGRLLLWKVTGQAIMEQPWTGTGLGGFPVAYAEAQAVYFASDKASETEKMVAGCPDYGFNEFLQVCLELGIFGFTVFVLLLGYSLFRGTKNGQIGISGSILALIVFSFASYPLQLPEFWVILVVLMAIINTTVFTTPSFFPIQDRKRIGLIVMVGILSVCCVEIFCQQKEYYQWYKKWNVSKALHNSKIYKAADDGYEELVPVLGHKPEFLLEAALCLNRTERYAEANSLLYRAMKLSCDPMIYYITAKNEQSMRNYEKAERLLLHAIDILPERIYPYYLLAKLYWETDFFQKNKFLRVAETILNMKPKVENLAVREMQREIKQLKTECR